MFSNTKKLNQTGFAHIATVAIALVVVAGTAVAGYKIIGASSADSFSKSDVQSGHPVEHDSNGVTEGSIGDKYSVKISASPKPAPKKSTTYTIKITNSSTKNAFFGRQTLALVGNVTPAMSGGYFMQGSQGDKWPVLGEVQAKSTKTFKVTFTGPSVVNASENVKGIRLTVSQVTRDSQHVTDKNGGFHPKVKNYAYYK